MSISLGADLPGYVNLAALIDLAPLFTMTTGPRPEAAAFLSSRAGDLYQYECRFMGSSN